MSHYDAYRLSHEWQAYISRTHKLRKTFISVKGIYYQVRAMLQFSVDKFVCAVGWFTMGLLVFAGRG